MPPKTAKPNRHASRAGKKPCLPYKKSTIKVQPRSINVQKNPYGEPDKTGTGFATNKISYRIHSMSERPDAAFREGRFLFIDLLFLFIT
ncbi:hypothetical protein [Dickeya dianthicola]|uniref:Uncharacterized protein n=1 Tax=Dickeya dianthicola TaxID=204039 RepID=A0AAX1CBN3_9GAMM|nr:hypothetical protein [Dickeya dianthicola]ATO34902.1 hypothetical protein DDI_3734 [Dickeya dianthicola RNS04.9]MBI0439872.1 hypothetical protein [Dickeya dianthicola]MBI0451479.1 hypothetical protein [Dickeya dianthicola]MBI0455847.1 hypothetical protein [Dickeya dianthicola]MBI0488617.1 hypothetical protein [Dickeya dianthicola]